MKRSPIDEEKVSLLISKFNVFWKEFQDCWTEEQWDKYNIAQTNLENMKNFLDSISHSECQSKEEHEDYSLKSVKFASFFNFRVIVKFLMIQNARKN